LLPSRQTGLLRRSRWLVHKRAPQAPISAPYVGRLSFIARSEACSVDWPVNDTAASPRPPPGCKALRCPLVCGEFNLMYGGTARWPCVVHHAKRNRRPFIPGRRRRIFLAKWEYKRRVRVSRSAAFRPSKSKAGLMGAAARGSLPHRAKNGLAGDPGPAAQGVIHFVRFTARLKSP
jgi:hypothetical protein